MDQNLPALNWSLLKKPPVIARNSAPSWQSGLDRADGANTELAAATLEDLVERAKRIARHRAVQDVHRSKIIAWVVGVLALAIWWRLIR